MCWPKKNITHVIGLPRAGKTVFIARQTGMPIHKLDVLGDFVFLARRAQNVAAPEQIVMRFLEKPHSFDLEDLHDLFTAGSMQFIYAGRNQLKGVEMSNSLEYIIPNLKRLLEGTTRSDDLYGYMPTFPLPYEHKGGYERAQRLTGGGGSSPVRHSLKSVMSACSLSRSLIIMR